MTEATLTSATALSTNEDVVARAVGEDLILLDLEAGTYYSLNGVGAIAWRGIAEARPLDAIAADVAAAYDVSEGRARDDIRALIAELIEKGLLVQA